MAKIITWLIVIFVVMLALRIVNMRNARRRAGEATARGSAGSGSAPAAMVRCDRCGTYVPREEARQLRGGYVCIGGECAAHA